MGKYSAILIMALVIFVGCNNNHKNQEKPIIEIIDDALDFSVKQSMLMAQSLKDKPDRLPKSLTSTGALETCSSHWWVSGFFPGQLWYLYEYSKDEQVKDWATIYMKRVEKEKFTTDNHDVGFIIFCSYGNAFRITRNEDYLEVISTAANSLSTRFDPKIGSIRSWDYASWNKQWQYPVIIDNMMNLELLTWSSKKYNVPLWMDIAISHANNSMRDHYRSDFSCYHVVSYDIDNGEVEKKNTSQGYSHESAWSRGQSWGLYGFVMMFRETGDGTYLEQAKNIANFLINHPRLPEDKIPYWDFDYPAIPDTYRDVSAATIMCSALIELSQMVGEPEKSEYLAVAEKQIRSLSAPPYINELGTTGNFILKHSVGHFPNKTELDVPLTYADYYFIEALMRMRAICKNN